MSNISTPSSICLAFTLLGVAKPICAHRITYLISCAPVTRVLAKQRRRALAGGKSGKNKLQKCWISKDEYCQLPLEIEENLPARNQLARGRSRGYWQQVSVATWASAPSRVFSQSEAIYPRRGIFSSSSDGMRSPRLLALVIEPHLLLWPLLVHGWFLRSRGSGPRGLRPVRR